MSAEYGIIGYPLSHSFSPAYFNKKFEEEGIDASYGTFSLHNIDVLPALLQEHKELLGLSVTIPYKETVIPFLDALDPVAEKIGAINCIRLQGGKTKGYNTDVIGFEKSLAPLLKPNQKHALILGTGGASKAVAYVLNKLGISFQKVSRTSMGCLHYDDVTADLLQRHQIIINTTPLGMFPQTETYPLLPYEFIGEQHLLYDLVYNPVETKFLSFGKDRGAIIKNGIEMLELQAEESWRIWNPSNSPKGEN